MKSVRVAVLAALAISCAQRSQPGGNVTFTVDAVTSGGAITSVTGEVPPANVSMTLAYDSASGKFKGAIDVPSGAQTFTMRAYAGSRLVGTGSATANVVSGQTVNVFITILDTTGPLPTPPNRPYVTSLVVPATVEAGAQAIFTATAVDPQGDALTYEWSQSCNPAAAGTFGALGAASTTWTAPDSATKCEITVKATSASGLYDTKNATLAVAGDGTVDVTVQYVPQPVIEQVSLQTYAVPEQEVCSVLRDDATATCPDALSAGGTWKVVFTYQLGTTEGLSASLTDDCGGKAIPNPQATTPISSTGAEFQWTAPSSAGVCILKAMVTSGGLTDTFPVEVVLVGSAPSPTYVISGTVSGDVAADVAVSITGSATASTTTDAAGNYAFSGLADGAYVVTPMKSGYTFLPASRTVAVMGGNASGSDFAASAVVAATWSRVLSTESKDAPHGVWGSGLSDVWVAGGSKIWRWNGSIWSNTLASNTAELSGIWGTGPNDVWAVGTDQLSGTSVGAVLHWNGNLWSSALLTGAPFRTVWGSGANDVWVGGNGETMMHWDGTAWSSISTGERTASSNIFQGIWGSGANDVWAVGGSWIKHWDGGAWSSFPVSTSTYLWGAWGSGPSDVWAVGNDSSGNGMIMHWNGSAWSSAVIGSNPFYGVWGSGANDVLAVGAGDVVLHWDGNAWSSVPTGTNAHSIWNVWGAGPNNLWATAWDASALASANGLILQYH